MNKILKPDDRLREMAKNCSNGVFETEHGIDQDPMVSPSLAKRMTKLGIIMMDGRQGLSQKSLEEYVAREEKSRAITPRSS